MQSGPGLDLRRRTVGVCNMGPCEQVLTRACDLFSQVGVGHSEVSQAVHIGRLGKVEDLFDDLSVWDVHGSCGFCLELDKPGVHDTWWCRGRARA